MFSSLENEISQLQEPIGNIAVSRYYNVAKTRKKNL